MIPDIVTLEELENLGDVSPVLTTIFPEVAKRFNEHYQATSGVVKTTKPSNVVRMFDYQEKSMRPQSEDKVLQNIDQLKEIFEIGRSLKTYRDETEIVCDYNYLCHVINEELHKRPHFQHLWVR